MSVWQTFGFKTIIIISGACYMIDIRKMSHFLQGGAML